MHRSFNPEVMKKAVEPYPELVPQDYPFEEWLGNKNNVMLVEDDNVGLACYEYPGVVTGHYFFRVGGRKALDLAKRMMNVMVDEHGVKAFTGITPANNKAARWFNRHLGFTSYGVMETAKGPHEMFCMTADELKGKMD